jgi:CheY-like chemotaxis protein
MGGEVGVSSTPGAGSTFWFTARLRKADESQIPAAVSEPAEKAESILAREYRHCRLLLVEDEPINQMVAQALLDDVGLASEVAVDGLEAVEKAGRNPYDLILMDMRMPKLDGLDATRRIRTLPGRDTMPIVAMTANAFAEDKAQCLEAGMNDFLSKPVLAQQLYEVLLKWLPCRRQPDASEQPTAQLPG